MRLYLSWGLLSVLCEHFDYYESSMRTPTSPVLGKSRILGQAERRPSQANPIGATDERRHTYRGLSIAPSVSKSPQVTQFPKLDRQELCLRGLLTWTSQPNGRCDQQSKH